MSYRPDDFIISLLQELFDAGFINTTREIARTIADGEMGRPYQAVEQERITADIIEHNIIRPFEAWQKIVENHGPNDKGDKDEKFLLIVDQSGQRVSLGSHSYSLFIKMLREFVRNLRSPPKPDPDPKWGTGGTPPPTPPNPAPTPVPDHKPLEDGNVHGSQHPKTGR